MKPNVSGVFGESEGGVGDKDRVPSTRVNGRRQESFLIRGKIEPWEDDQQRRYTLLIKGNRKIS